MTDRGKKGFLITRRKTLPALSMGIIGMTTHTSHAARQQAAVTQIRNATLRINYAGVRFLVDPMLDEQGTSPGFAGSANSERRNPLVPLPLSIADITDVDAVIVTHLHTDHWDSAAKVQLAKSLPLFTQNEDDAATIREAGFTDVRVLTEASEFKGVKLARTGGQHGTDATLKAVPRLGKVCGVVFSHPSEKTLYIAGDTIWNGHVEQAIAKHRPDVIVLNAGKATFIGLDPIIMGEEDVRAVHRAAPKATLIASHMEAVNHCILSRAELRAFAEREGFAASLRVPADGETVTI
ncbi:MBL fold metallo-hydrolase [Pseudoroseomonas ludipueritiae]|uniref:MBL fold metallo-hydrolase n=1 Tax=Pseudoroseomonas ludipueritiae TaxID=198093 RepID=A0ABR7RB73_9PROT|nr:MBL fold metallo-hydrolase [Pseudoroseomonas ludipueritiae]MBC9179081.1 MBL fold metallo-hydrolase [Pseudoroseomonas ludipueritiae]